MKKHWRWRNQQIFDNWICQQTVVHFCRLRRLIVELLNFLNPRVSIPHCAISLDFSPFSPSPSPDSYSAAGSEGSISTSVVSLPPQASGSSAPSSPGSRRSVSTLKKWLTNPVRKLSAGATAKGERQVRKLEGKPPPLASHSHSQDLGSPPRSDDMLTILPVTHRELVRDDFTCIIMTFPFFPFLGSQHRRVVPPQK